MGVILFALPLCAFADWSSIEEYYDSLQKGCQSDSDCVEKNVGNCCGGYPKCVRKDSLPNPAWVSKFCVAQGMAGVCGFPKIDGCKCVEQRCQDVVKSFGGLGGSASNAIELR